ncbi:myb-like protein X [Lucilia sericata]|uniref:myb-like protein X n=1 Tax=Lucilia sericata TaxID=13632 RepID=UPI0018A86F08|nr:myb-like protein X [Lucilia sericata]
MDSLRIDQEFYKTLTPLKRKTFSETMLIRRSPFLHCENQNSGTENRGKCLYCSKRANNTNNSKTKENNIQSKQISCSTRIPSSSSDRKLTVKTAEIETVTKNENNSEYETETWLKLQNDLRNLKLRQEKRTHKPQSSEIEIKTTEKETRNGNNKKLNQGFQSDNKDFQEKQQSSLTSFQFETFPNRTNNGNETFNCEESTQISGYYSEDSKEESSSILDLNTSSENSLNAANHKIKPLTNSTFICPQETSENESQEFQTAANSFQENGNETTSIETREKLPSPKKYPFYKPENFHIPLIIINEIEIIHHGLEVAKPEKKSLKSLKVPLITIKSEFEENKELQKKLIEMKLYKQIDIKDKVMAHLLEISRAIDFPKLKHLCNLMCEKTDDGSCKKMLLEKEKEKKVEEESGGFFYSIWSAIKYPFVPNPSKIEEKYDIENKKEEDKEKNEEKERSEEKISEDLEKADSKRTAKDNLDNKEDIPKRIILDKGKETSKKIQPTDSLDNKENKEPKNLFSEKEDSGTQKEDTLENYVKETNKDFNNTEQKVIRENDNVENLKNLKTDHISKDIDKTNNFLEEEKKNEDLNLLIQNTDKIIVTKEEDSKMEATNNNNLKQDERKTNTNAEDESSNKKTDNSCPKPTANLESNKKIETEQQDKKQTKKKKGGFFSFFSKREKTDKDNKNPESKEPSNENAKKIDDMEQVLEELEKEEEKLKLEKFKEALKKAEKLTAIETKSRSKRAGSF